MTKCFVFCSADRNVVEYIFLNSTCAKSLCSFFPLTQDFYVFALTFIQSQTSAAE